MLSLSGVWSNSVPQPCRIQDKIPTLELNFCLVLLRLAVDPAFERRCHASQPWEISDLPGKSFHSRHGIPAQSRDHINVEHGSPQVAGMAMQMIQASSGCHICLHAY